MSRERKTRSPQGRRRRSPRRGDRAPSRSRDSRAPSRSRRLSRQSQRPRKSQRPRQSSRGRSRSRAREERKESARSSSAEKEREKERQRQPGPATRSRRAAGEAAGEAAADGVGLRRGAVGQANQKQLPAVAVGRDTSGKDTPTSSSSSSSSESKKDDAPPGTSSFPVLKERADRLVTRMMEIYNERVPSVARFQADVDEKTRRFCDFFTENVRLFDLMSGGMFMKDRDKLSMRYGCVFRESGADLRGLVTKRMFYWEPGNFPTYCLQYETHEHLVTADPGSPLDGSSGVREPRTEHLVVLYEEWGSKITRMWLTRDADKIGVTPRIDEDKLSDTSVFQACERKVAELKRGRVGPRVYTDFEAGPR